MKNTPEQEQLFLWVDKRSGHGILNSVAGSGKTTSIIQCLNYIDDEHPVIVCSFTKMVAVELDKRVRAERFTNVNSTTLNALGWALCKQNVRDVKLDQFKTDNILRYQLARLGLEKTFQQKIFTTAKGTVKRVIGLLKGYVVRPDIDNFKEAVKKIVVSHDIDPIEGTTEQAIWARENLLTLIESVYRTSISFLQEMDFDDQKFMPVYHGWGGESPAFIIVDECQDSNVCDIKLVKSLVGVYKGQPTRTLWVGDPKQSIYGFRGSLPDAMDQIKDEFNCHEMSLSVCWRCPDKVLAMAREICPIITGPTPNPRGEGTVETVTTPEFKEGVEVGDYVICRTSAPLVKRCLELVRRNIPAMVKGKDLGRTLLTLIESIQERLQKAGIPQVGTDKEEYLRAFVRELQLYKSEQVMALDNAGREEQAIAISDKCEGLEAFCLDATALPEVALKIESLFADDVKDDEVVLFLTGHKAKGLQRKRVWFLRPDICPHPRAKSANAQTQERNLRYVIITRSESELYFVTREKDEK
jgi:DNA helicase-2/ATP-dependent DNA helicase PcrA